MGSFIIDTEGTGIFKHHHVQPDGTKITARSDEPGQPRMAEFAMVEVDDNFNVIATYQQYVLPVGWQNEDGSPMLEMPQGAFEVNKLSMDFLRANGKPVGLALDRYVDAVERGLVLIGFNQQHDGRQIRAELRRADRDDLFELTPNICAMRSITTNYREPDLPNGKRGPCKVKKINGKGGFVGLIDAAAHFGIAYSAEKRHTALEDAMVTAEVAKRLHQMGLLLPAEVHYSRNYQGPRNGEQS